MEFEFYFNFPITGETSQDETIRYESVVQDYDYFLNRELIDWAEDHNKLQNEYNDLDDNISFLNKEIKRLEHDIETEKNKLK